MHSVDYNQAHSLVCFEKVTEWSDGQVEFMAVHTLKNEQIWKNLFDKSMLIVCYLFLSRGISEALEKLVLIVDLFDFFVKLSSTETTLHINKNSEQFLAFVYLNWFNSLELRVCLRPLLRKDSRQYEVIYEFEFTNLIIKVNVQKLILLEAVISQ